MKSVYKFNQIPSEAQIKKHLRKILFGANLHCPNCNTRKIVTGNERYWCSRCRRRFSLLSHTWLAHLRLPIQQFWLILWCWTQQVPVKQTAAFSELSIPTIYHWFEVFRSHLPQDQELLEHLVQLDEAYFGSRDKKTLRALFMGKQIDTRKLAFRIQSTFPVRGDAWDFLIVNVAPNSQLATDGAKIYRGIDQWWPIEHSYDIHRKFEFVQTSEIEGVFGCLRTFIRRMYHHVSSDKLPSVVQEFCCRFSHPEMFESPYQYLLITLHLAPLS
jgi:transposase-like protein